MGNILSKPVVKGSFSVATLSKEEMSNTQSTLNEDGNFISDEELEEIKNEYYDKGKTEATEETMETVQNTKKEAYEEGLVTGRTEAIEELEPKYLAMKAIFDEWEATKEKFLKELELEAVELSLAIEKKIIGSEVQKSKKPLEYIIKETLGIVKERKGLRVKVSFEDEEYFREGGNQFVETLGEDIEVVADPDIEAGGCVVETALGQLDARLEERWRLIVNKFFAGIERGDNDLFSDMFEETGESESGEDSGEGGEDSGPVS